MEINRRQINRIQEGQEFTNYKELCKVMKIEPLLGNSKKAQLKEISQYCDIQSVEGSHKLIVKEIYKKKRPIKDLREDGNNSKEYPEFKISKEYYNSSGVYIIENSEEVYIGSTTDFRKRFIRHKRGTQQPVTKNLLEHGGTFSMLWLAPKDVTKEQLLEKEKEYALHYLYNDSRKLVNDLNAAPLSLHISGLANRQQKKKEISYIHVDIKVKIEDYANVVILLDDYDIEYKKGKVEYK